LVLKTFPNLITLRIRDRLVEAADLAANDEVVGMNDGGRHAAAQKESKQAHFFWLDRFEEKVK